VSEAELLHPFAVGAHGTDIAAELRLWEDNPDSHASPPGCVERGIAERQREPTLSQTSSAVRSIP
jgi:hypothetical protein